jgi:hypothetical protein
MARTSFNARVARSNPLWTSGTSTDVVAGGVTNQFVRGDDSAATSQLVKSNYCIVDNTSGGVVKVCPSGTTVGVNLAPGETFEFALAEDAGFAIVNGGGSDATLIWLD